MNRPPYRGHYNRSHGASYNRPPAPSLPPPMPGMPHLNRVQMPDLTRPPPNMQAPPQGFGNFRPNINQPPPTQWQHPPPSFNCVPTNIPPQPPPNNSGFRPNSESFSNNGGQLQPYQQRLQHSQQYQNMGTQHFPSRPAVNNVHQRSNNLGNSNSVNLSRHGHPRKNAPNLQEKQQMQSTQQPKVGAKQNAKSNRASQERKFTCVVCDRAYATEENYKIHLDQHVTCSYKDCKYNASPKLVDIHIKHQHLTGFAKKISWSTDSAEIKAWQAARRKHYPTAENVAKQIDALKDKQARGEVLTTKEFTKMKRRQNNRRHMEEKQHHKAKPETSIRQKGQCKQHGKTEKSSPHQKRQLLKSNDRGSPTEDATSTDPLSAVLSTSTSSNVQKGSEDGVGGGLQPPSGALGSLISYNSDSDDNGSDSNQEDKKDAKQNSGEENTSHSSEEEEEDHKKSRKRKYQHQDEHKERRGGKKARRGAQKKEKRRSLLEMLLARDIRKERNIILQCIRHIVSKGFYENETE